MVAVKVTPSNQTLILASEGPGSGSQTGNSFLKLSGDVTGGAVLQRVTIVAARPDAVVYLRADYAPERDDASSSSAPSPTYFKRAAPSPSQPPTADAQTEAESSNTALVAQHPRPTGAADYAGNLRDSFGNATATGYDAGLSSYLKPAEQYARTQRMLSATPQAQYIDVHA